MNNCNRKLLTFKETPKIIENLKKQGEKIVQCHGTFDLIHPGHLVHFEEAKALGDILVVTITGKSWVNKGPGRPFFNDQMRIKYLTSLEMVDYVVVIPFPAAIEAIECVKPDVYCKGKEYLNVDNDVTGNILDDIRAVEGNGGRMAYVGSIVFSSTKLLNKHFETYSPEAKAYYKYISADYSSEDFKKIVDSFSGLKVLVVGDIIFDKYTTVNIQGLTSKNRIMSGRFLYENMQAGGSLAVFRHLAQFTPDVKILSLVGKEPWVERELAKYLNKNNDLIIRSSKFTTVVKQRFTEPMQEGKELNKLFSVNYIDKEHPDKSIENRLLKKLKNIIKEFDMVMVMDFGHGIMQERMRNCVQEESKFLALNCQTNSNNHGFNIITRQYSRADSFSLDNMEMTLACGKKQFVPVDELENVRRRFNSKYCWFTRGAIETIGIKHNADTSICPPFENEVIDPIGAGDAFCSLASLAAVKKLPIHLSTFMGQLAGAQAVRIIGNSKSIKKGDYLKAGVTMLSY